MQAGIGPRCPGAARPSSVVRPFGIAGALTVRATLPRRQYEDAGGSGYIPGSAGILPAAALVNRKGQVGTPPGWRPANGSSSGSRGGKAVAYFPSRRRRKPPSDGLRRRSAFVL